MGERILDIQENICWRLDKIGATGIVSESTTSDPFNLLHRLYGTDLLKSCIIGRLRGENHARADQRSGDL